jgi:hypothetical protein
VRHMEGLMHGFLALHTLDGKRLADGEMTQIAEGPGHQPPDFSLQGRLGLLRHDHIFPAVSKLPPFEHNANSATPPIHTETQNLNLEHTRSST